MGRSASPVRRSRRSPSPSRHRSRRSPSPSRHRSRRSPSVERKSRHDSRSRSPTSSRSSHRSSKRRHSRSPSESRHRSRRSHGSDSKRRSRRRSVSTSSSSSDSSSEDDKRKRREHKKHKKDKKHKKSKKKSKKSKVSIGDQWGKYGIIHEADIFSKEAEFQAWLIEVKNANVEILNNIKRKEMFIDFMEDYNTATMPHEKFYNLHKWDKRQEALRMGEKPIPTGDFFDFRNDEEKLKMQHRQAARAVASRQPTLKLSEEQIKELSRINRERVEADRMRKMGLKPRENMGVRYEEEEQ